MKLQVTIKNIYGRELVYPQCDTSKQLARLAGVKTFNTTQLSIIKGLGYTLEVITPTL